MDTIWEVHVYFPIRFYIIILVDFQLIGCRLHFCRYIYLTFCFLQFFNFIHEIGKTLASNLNFRMLLFNTNGNSFEN